MTNSELYEEINALIGNKISEDKQLINEFFNLLFWKDYSSGYLDEEDKQNILFEIEKNTKGFSDEYKRLDTDAILPFINKIRKSIGLPELTLEINNCIMEITDEVKQQLIIKGLK